MPKNQRKSRPRRTNKRRSNRRGSDPSFSHTLSFTAYSAVSTPTNGLVIPVPFSSMSGAPQLSAFFEMFKPTHYRTKTSYINWSGTVAFIPFNPALTNSVPILSNVDVAALMEVRGSVRLESGARNDSSWSTFPYASIGIPTYNIFSSNANLGYLVFYNDAPVVSNWTVQTTVEIKVRFFRRTLYNFSITPTRSTKVVEGKDALTDSEISILKEELKE